MQNGNLCSLGQKFTIFLTLHLTIAPYCQILILLFISCLNLLSLNKHGLSNPSFSTPVENSWHTLESLPSSSSPLSRFQHHLKYLTSNIIDWNKNHFGNLFRKKHHLLARLRGIQLALSCRSSTFLYSLENQLIQDYNHTLHQEFLFSQLKSRITWLNYRDANTKFFHLKTLQHRSQSHIMTLKDSSGLWVSRETLTTHITTAFTKLFTSASPHITS